MTAVTHRHPPAAVSSSAGHETNPVVAVPSSPATSIDTGVGAPVDSCLGTVEALRQERDIAVELVALQHDPALLEALTPAERQADRKVAERLRAAARREQLSAGREQLRRRRRARVDERWSARAVGARERLLNPNRRLASSYRRYVVLSSVTVALVVAGVAWMSVTVHHGLVGVDGPPIAYLVEPLASVLLAVSMFAQFTAVAHGRRNPWWFVALDVALAAASLLLNVVPWGLRFGWDLGDLIAHILPPLLIAAAVVVNHMLNSLFSAIFADVHVELGESLRLNDETADVLVLVERTRRAITEGSLAVDDQGMPSKEQIRKRFGIGKARAQLTGDALDLLTTLR
jgi:hypothetical protein